MSDVIAEYQQWKQKGGDLRTRARQAMEARFRELLLDAVKLSEEYRADFGSSLKPPPVVTSFRYKTGKSKKTAAAPKPAPAPILQKETPPAKPDPKLRALQKRLAAAQQKLEAAKTAGKPTRDLEDRVYEAEDALRIATSGD